MKELLGTALRGIVTVILGVAAIYVMNQVFGWPKLDKWFNKESPKYEKIYQEHQQRMRKIQQRQQTIDTRQKKANQSENNYGIVLNTESADKIRNNETNE